MVEENKKTPRQLEIENLVYQLNHLGIERQEHMDALFLLEQRSEPLRRRLIKLLDGGLENF